MSERLPHFTRRHALALLCVWVITGSLYANASFLVEDRASLRFFPPFVAGFDANANRHLGAEYWNIARALAAGRGFSDPFFVASGPTAWMPPVYPALLAAAFTATGSETAVVVGVVIAKGLVLIATGMLVFGAAARTRLRIAPVWALVAYLAWITAHFDWFFQITHDLWWLIALVDAVLLGAWHLLDRPVTPTAAAAFGALGGLVALSSPILAAAWGTTALFIAWRRNAWGPLLASIALALTLLSPWVWRNHAVFGEWILVKSNLVYDLYQANYVSPTGVYDEPFLLRHPVWTTMRARDSVYRSQGEAAFLADYRTRLGEALRENPGAVTRRAVNRALAATLVYRPYRPRTEGRHPPLRTLLHPLPFLGLIVLVVATRGRPGDIRASALVLYGVALAPYVVAAFYIRYLLPLTPILALLAFWGADAAAAWRDSGRDDVSPTGRTR